MLLLCCSTSVLPNFFIRSYMILEMCTFRIVTFLLVLAVDCIKINVSANFTAGLLKSIKIDYLHLFNIFRWSRFLHPQIMEAAEELSKGSPTELSVHRSFFQHRCVLQFQKDLVFFPEVNKKKINLIKDT